MKRHDNSYSSLETFTLLSLYLLMYFIFLFWWFFAFLLGKTFEQSTQQFEQWVETIAQIFLKNKNLKKENSKNKIKPNQQSFYCINQTLIENDDLIKNKNKKRA